MGVVVVVVCGTLITLWECLCICYMHAGLWTTWVCAGTRSWPAVVCVSTPTTSSMPSLCMAVCWPFTTRHGTTVARTNVKHCSLDPATAPAPQLLRRQFSLFTVGKLLCWRTGLACLKYFKLIICSRYLNYRWLRFTKIVYKMTMLDCSVREKSVLRYAGELLAPECCTEISWYIACSKMHHFWHKHMSNWQTDIF